MNFFRYSFDHWRGKFGGPVKTAFYVSIETFWNKKKFLENKSTFSIIRTVSKQILDSCQFFFSSEKNFQNIQFPLISDIKRNFSKIFWKNSNEIVKNEIQGPERFLRSCLFYNKFSLETFPYIERKILGILFWTSRWGCQNWFLSFKGNICAKTFFAKTTNYPQTVISFGYRAEKGCRWNLRVPGNYFGTRLILKNDVFP